MKQVIVIESILREVFYVDSPEDVELQELSSLDNFSSYAVDPPTVVSRRIVDEFPKHQKEENGYMNASTWKKDENGEWVEDVRWDLR